MQTFYTPSMERLGKTSKTALTTGYIFSFAIIGMISASQGPMLSTLANLANVDLDKAALLFTLRGLGTLIGAIGGSRLYDHFPSSKLQAFFLLIVGLGYLALPFASFFMVQLILIAIGGFSAAALNTGGSTGVIRLFGEKSHGVINALHFAFGTGAFFVPMLIEGIGIVLNNKLIFYWGLAAIMILLGIIFLFLPNPPVVENNKETPEKKRSSFLFLGGCFIAFIFYVGAEVTLAGWIYTYVMKTGLGDSGRASLINSLFWIVYTLFRLGVVPIAHRIHLGKFLIISSFLSFITLILMALLRFIPWSVWIFVPLTGLFYSPIFPTVYSFAQKHVGLTGKRAGIILSGGSIGGMLFPYATGLILKKYGAVYLPHILSVMTGCLVIILFILVLKTRGKSEQKQCKDLESRSGKR